MSIGQVLTSVEQYKSIVERDTAVAELNRIRNGGTKGVTVCVPCFEQSEWLPDALRSVSAQTQAPYEVIVVDDGSNLVEASKIKEISEGFGATYMRVTNRGLPSARNVALMNARTFAFLPLDSDDWIEPTYIEKTMALLLDGADVVVPGLQEHGPTRNGTYMPGFDRPLDQVTLDVMWEFNRTFYCSLFRTSVLQNVGGYNGRMTLGFEDYDLAIDLMERGYKYVACNEVLFNYRTRPDSMLAESMRRKNEIMNEMYRHHRKFD